MAKHAQIGRDVLEMALIGYQGEKARLETAIAAIQAELGQRGASGQKAGKNGAGPTPAKRRAMSASGRRRIAAAQRKRWAVLKQAKAGEEKPKEKRKLSAAGRKAIIEATKKRWAAIRASKAKVTPKGKKQAA